MAFLSVSGEPGCRASLLARMLAQQLGWDLVTEERLEELIAGEFGASGQIMPRAWPHLASAVIAKLGSERRLIVCGDGSAMLLADLPSRLRLHLTGSETYRLANVMRDDGVDREEAKRRLRELEREQAFTRKTKFGSRSGRTSCDLVLNCEGFSNEQMVDLLASAVRFRRLGEAGPLPPAEEAEVQFRIRMRLARSGIAPTDCVRRETRDFGHPSEEVFANLLDFYRIVWHYEPRSFPLQWDKDGKVLEAFTPDFYLPEFDIYVELTTMRQANVTRKNRKIHLLRTIYPHINIQVFYQKDVQDLVMKHGLPARLAAGG